MVVVKVHGLTKKYRDFTLSDVSFTLSSGRITGFVGRNGAGKTTTIKSMLGMVHPDSGSVSYFDMPFAGNEAAIKKRIGYSTGTVSWYPRKKIIDIVDIVKRFYDTWDDEEIQLHDSIETSKNPYRKWVLDRWFEKNDKALFVKDGEMVRPSASMNLIFQLIRLYRLFLYQGITLRDLMDFFFAMKRVAGHGRASTINYEKVIKSLGLLGFSRGVIWVMQEVFGLGEEEQIVKPLESQGTFILHEVMAGRHRFFRLAMKHPVEMLCSLLP